MGWDGPRQSQIDQDGPRWSEVMAHGEQIVWYGPWCLEMVPNGLKYLRWSLVGRDGLGWSKMVRYFLRWWQMVPDEIIPLGQMIRKHSKHFKHTLGTLRYCIVLSIESSLHSTTTPKFNRLPCSASVVIEFHNFTQSFCNARIFQAVQIVSNGNYRKAQ